MSNPSICDLSGAGFERNRSTIMAIQNGLSQFNVSQRPDASARPVILALVDDQDAVIGGLLGRLAYGWLRIDTLWVAEAYRRRGFGRELLHTAEQLALEHGCHTVHLDTYSFQAFDFYRHLGYEIFGKLENYPEDDVHYYLKKSLRSSHT